MGIGQNLALKVGLPIALIVGAGLILYRFKTPIIAAVTGGANTLGTTIAAPFGGFLQGINEGFKNVPTKISIPFPTFDFTFGGKSSSGFNETKGFDCKSIPFGLAGSCANDTNKSGDSGQGTIIVQDPNGNTTVNGKPVDKNLKPILTSVGGKKTVTIHNKISSMSIEDILQKFPHAVGLFDFKGTKETEFLPLSREEVSFFGKSNLKLSSQIFKEIKNIDAV